MRNIWKLLFTCGLLLLPVIAHAAIEQDVQDILENLKKVLNPTLKLLLAISFVIGVVFILRGLMTLRQFSMPLTQATRPGELSGPLVYIFVGAVMVYIPTSTDVLSQTVFGGTQKSIFGAQGLGGMGKASDELMGYGVSQSVEDQWATLVDTVAYYVQFIGFLAFLRGWMLIAHAGQPGVQPGTISRGMVHIIGGILAINFLPLVKVIHNTIVG